MMISHVSFVLPYHMHEETLGKHKLARLARNNCFWFHSDLHDQKVLWEIYVPKCKTKDKMKIELHTAAIGTSNKQT